MARRSPDDVSAKDDKGRKRSTQSKNNLVFSQRYMSYE